MGKDQLENTTLTENKTLKKNVRARMAATGESYTAPYRALTADPAEAHGRLADARRRGVRRAADQVGEPVPDAINLPPTST